jgi:hypothetical protein
MLRLVQVLVRVRCLLQLLLLEGLLHLLHLLLIYLGCSTLLPPLLLLPPLPLCYKGLRVLWILKRE